MVANRAQPSPDALDPREGEQFTITRSDGSDVAVDLAALTRLARPNAVFSDARQWSEYVGVDSEISTDVVTSFTRTHRIRQDVFSGPRGWSVSLPGTTFSGPERPIPLHL